MKLNLFIIMKFLWNMHDKQLKYSFLITLWFKLQTCFLLQILYIFRFNLLLWSLNQIVIFRGCCCKFLSFLNGYIKIKIIINKSIVFLFNDPGQHFNLWFWILYFIITWNIEEFLKSIMWVKLCFTIYQKLFLIQ
jgi:hypothetical protein